MTQERANIICYLISDVISDDDFTYSVLDLATGQEFFFNDNPDRMHHRIQDEIEVIQSHWA